ncbi:hypothetical protein NKCBBBOE_01658 [Pseudarthrobacter sp. MM222]|nr:hypothetical protein NKCBBBOE_01658 [Pseudarthrobacter sp. MM222]
MSWCSTDTSRPTSVRDRDIRTRIKRHWSGTKQFDRLIFGTKESSILSIDSFWPLDTMRIFAPKPPGAWRWRNRWSKRSRRTFCSTGSREVNGLWVPGSCLGRSNSGTSSKAHPSPGREPAAGDEGACAMEMTLSVHDWTIIDTSIDNIAGIAGQNCDEFTAEQGRAVPQADGVAAGTHPRVGQGCGWPPEDENLSMELPVVTCGSLSASCAAGMRWTPWQTVRRRRSGAEVP